MKIHGERRFQKSNMLKIDKIPTDIKYVGGNAVSIQLYIISHMYSDSVGLLIEVTV